MRSAKQDWVMITGCKKILLGDMIRRMVKRLLVCLVVVLLIPATVFAWGGFESSVCRSVRVGNGYVSIIQYVQAPRQGVHIDADHHNGSRGLFLLLFRHPHLEHTRGREFPVHLFL